MEIKKRYSNIDLLESIAIFFVIIYHSTLYTFDITENETMINYILYFGRTILSTCVPLFFFANGYLLFNKEFDLRKHIKKILRLVLLTFFWTFFLMPVYMIIAGEPLSLKTILVSIFRLDITWSMNFFWFLGTLVCMYILFPALKALFDLSKKSFIFFIVACAVLTFGFVMGNQMLAFFGAILHHHIPSLSQPLLTMFNPFHGSYGYAFVYFCVGGLIYTYEPKILALSRTKRNIISIAGIFISCTLLFVVGVIFTKYIDGKVWDVVWNGYNTVFTFVNVILIYLLCLNYTKEYSFIKNISINTLGIYFTHELIIRLTRPWIKSREFLCNLPVNIFYAFVFIYDTFLVVLYCFYT